MALHISWSRWVALQGGRVPGHLHFESFLDEWSKMAEDSTYESILCVKPEVHVYKIPPRATNRGYRWVCVQVNPSVRNCLDVFYLIQDSACLGVGGSRKASRVSGLMLSDLQCISLIITKSRFMRSANIICNRWPKFNHYLAVQLK